MATSALVPCDLAVQELARRQATGCSGGGANAARCNGEPSPWPTALTTRERRFVVPTERAGVSQPAVSKHLAASCIALAGLLGWPQIARSFPGARMSRQIDYYFSLQSPWAYIGHKLFREVVSTYDLKVNHKPVVLVDLFSETGGLPLAEAPSGAAALSHGRTAALARQARPDISSSAGELAVQRAAGRWRRDRGDRGRPRSRSIPAPGLCGGVGRPAQSGRSRDPDQTGRRFRTSRQAAGRAFGTDEISATYEQNRQDALAADVFGSPVYVLDGEVFWGQDRIELLADALKSGRAPYRSQV